MLDRSVNDLVLSLVAASVTAGRKAMPPGRREEVVALLTDLMAAGDRLGAYVGMLDEELTRRGFWLEMLEAPDLDIPFEQIAREGFGNLPDENLADIALSPGGLEEIREHLDDPANEVGKWLIEAALADERSRPPDAESSERVRRALEKVIGRPVGDPLEF